MDRQKILLIFGAAWVSAALLTWFVYAKTQGPKTEKTVKVLATTRDLPAGARIKKGDVKLVNYPENDLPRSALLDEKVVLDRVLLYPLNAGEAIVSNKLTSSSGAEGLPAMIEPGKRAISVQVNDASGVAGLIQPRSKVDVIFTRPGSMREAVTTILLQDVTVLSIGRVTEVAVTPAGGGSSTPTATPSSTAQRTATLMVSPEDAAKLEWAKNQGKIGLALRNPTDRASDEEPQPVTAMDLNPAFLRTRGAGGVPNLRDDYVWRRLTGAEPAKPKPPVVVEKKEPPKPRYVIDVYRGDKHVQETFQ